METLNELLYPTGQLLQTKTCTQRIEPVDWDPKTNQAVTTFKVLAQRDFKKDGDKEIYLHFNPIPGGDAPDIFTNYQIPYLQVQRLTLICTKRFTVNPL